MWCLSLAVIALAQEPSPIEFKFKDAPVDAVLDYISRRTGYVFIRDPKLALTGTVSAISTAPIPLERVLDFLNSALRPLNAAVEALDGKIVRIVSADPKLRSAVNIALGADPDKLENSDKPVTQIVPLKNLKVSEFDKNLKDLYPKGVEVARDPVNNLFVFSGPSTEIRRFLVLLRMLDVPTFGTVKFEILTLSHSNATETAKMLNEVFGKSAADQNAILRANGMPPHDPARDLPAPAVRIVADPPANALIISGIEDSVQAVKEFAVRLDALNIGVSQIHLFHLQHANAKEIAEHITTLFKPADAPQDPMRRWQMAQMGIQPPEPQATGVRAIFDRGTNSVIVAGTEGQIKMIEKLIDTLDQGSSEIFKSYPLRFADAAQVAAMIVKLFSEAAPPAAPNAPGPAPATPQPPTPQPAPPPPPIKAVADLSSNSVLVIGTDSQVKLIDRLIEELNRDRDGFQKIRIYALKHGNPEEVSKVIKGVARAAEVSTHAPTNSLIVKGTEEMLAMIDRLVVSLDVPPIETELTRVFQLKNARASNIQQLIQGLLNGGKAPAPKPAPPGPDVPIRGPQVPGPSNRLGPDAQDPATESDPIKGKADVQADDDTNSVVVRASPRTMEAIREIISRLDGFRPQVLVRVLIAEVTLDKSVEFGVEGSTKQANRTVKNDKLVETIRDAFSMGGGGFSYLLMADQFSAQLRAMARDGRLKVLATPRILVLDNQQASITVGKLVPFIQASRQTPEGSILNTIQYQDIGILLKVTPHINPDGLVTMVIHPEISEVASQSESVPISQGVLAPTFNKNAADTSVAVRHGQTIILGGLIREFEDHAVEKIPVLGDIPILGGLFSSTSQRKVRRELMVFITPHVVYNQAELEELTELEKSKLRLIDPRDIELKGKEWRSMLRD